MKKILATLLLLVMAATPLFSCNNSDVSEASDSQSTAEVISQTTPSPETDFEYSVLENGTISVDKYIGNAAEVVIPDTIDGKNVTEINHYAFYFASVKEISLPETVLTIDYSAFAYCTELEKAVLPTSLKKLGGRAFFRCEALSSIELPSSLESIGSEVFRDCKSLRSLRIPPNCLTESSSELFVNSGIEVLELSDGITSIQSLCLTGMPALKKLILPTTLKKICYNAISDCPALEEVVLPDGLETVEPLAFSRDTKLTGITIPRSVKNISANVFARCESLTKIFFEGDAPDNIWCSDDYNDSDYYHQYMSKDHYTIYYHKGAKGFTSPTWYDYPTQIIE